MKVMSYKYLIACVATIIAAASYAQKDNSQLVEQTQISSDDGCHQLALSFNTPVQYLRHFPLRHGQLLEVVIKAYPSTYLTEYELGGKSYLMLEKTQASPLISAQFIHDDEQGSRLVFDFSSAVDFQVYPQADQRHLTIEYHQVGAPCKGAEQ